MTTRDGTIRLSYMTADVAATVEMMLAGEQVIASRSQRRRSRLGSAMVAALCMAGSAATVFVLIQLLVPGYDGNGGIFVMILAAILTWFGLTAWQGSAYGVLARIAIDSRFADGPQEMTVTPDGITLSNSAARWETRWPAIQAFTEGESAIGFVCGAVVLVVPKSAVTAAEIDTIRAWHAKGRNA